jgi:hypothetical protein
VRLGREACHVAYSSYDPGGQDGTYAAEDVGEGGARGLHLGLYATVQVRDLPVKGADTSRNTSEAKRRLRRAEVPLGRMPRSKRPAGWPRASRPPRRGGGPAGARADG